MAASSRWGHLARVLYGCVDHRLHKVRAYEVHAREVHAHEVHACEMHVYEVHA
jgi:hypothetical protein